MKIALCAAVVAAALGACALADERGQVDSVELGVSIERDQAEVWHELDELYEELVSRLADRGYTTADAQAAAAAGDDARARELFGYTDGEYEAIGRRAVVLSKAVQMAPPDTAHPDWGCDWGQAALCLANGVLAAVGTRGVGASGPVIGAIIVAEAGLCGWAFCYRERRDTGSGPSTGPRKK
jgi:hypothetical protein